MDEIAVSPDDSLVAATFRIGLDFGLVLRSDVIRWADYCIARVDCPSNWMIDLSLSQDCFHVDVLKLLLIPASRANPVATCRALYGLLPEPAEKTFAELERFAWRVYEVARACVGLNWDCALLSESDLLHDTALLARDGTYQMSENEVASQVQDFLDRERDLSVRRLLATI